MMPSRVELPFDHFLKFFRLMYCLYVREGEVKTNESVVKTNQLGDYNINH